MQSKMASLGFVLGVPDINKSDEYFRGLPWLPQVAPPMRWQISRKVSRWTLSGFLADFRSLGKPPELAF